MINLKHKTSGKKGQAAIEFMIVTLVVFFFLLFYMSFAFTLVASEYVDYVTFMAARTYKSASNEKSRQEQAAKQVFDKYLQPINSLVISPTLQFTNTGVTSTYQVDLFYLPPLFIKTGSPPSRLTLQSESLLGRDPSLTECQDFFSNFMNQFGLGNTFLANVMEDNGC